MDQMSMFSLEELPVSHSVSPDSEKDWMTRVATSCLPTLPLLQSIAPKWLVWENVPGVLSSNGGLDFASLLRGMGELGMGSHTGFLTLSTLEWPSAAAVCSLSDVLETGEVPRRFFLSATACRGILRRAEKRGKSLPPSLAAALQAVASAPTSTSMEE